MGRRIRLASRVRSAAQPAGGDHHRWAVGKDLLSVRRSTCVRRLQRWPRWSRGVGPTVVAVRAKGVVPDAQSAEPVQCLGRGSSGLVGRGLGSRAGAPRLRSRSGTDRGHRCRSRHRRAEHPSCEKTGLLPTSGGAGFSPGRTGGRVTVPRVQRRLTRRCLAFVIRSQRGRRASTSGRANPWENARWPSSTS
jgi:hypothetical protein